MDYFAVHYTYVDDAEKIAEHRPDHRAFLSRLTGKGLVAAGAYPEATPPAALLIVQAESIEDVEKMLADDPFRLRDVLAQVHIIRWTPVIGVFAD